MKKHNIMNIAISLVITVISNVLAYILIKNNIVRILFLVFSGLILITYCLIYYFRNKYMLIYKEQGRQEGEKKRSAVVFTVSAILIDSETKVALIKGDKEKQYKQPGSKYEKKDLETPFEKIKKTIEKETNLTQDDFKPIELEKHTFINRDGVVRDRSIEDIVFETEKYNFELFEDVKENIFTPAPFLIIELFDNLQVSNNFR